MPKYLNVVAHARIQRGGQGVQTRRRNDETPFKWRFAGGPMKARFKCYLDSLFPHKKNKNVRVWQNFLDPRMLAYIDDAHVGLRIVHED